MFKISGWLVTGLLALLLLWWFFITFNYLPLIILAVLLLLYFFKLARRLFALLLAMLLLVTLLVQTDFVQNIIIGKVTAKFSSRIKTRVSIKHVSFDFFNKMNLEGVMLRDQQSDTLLYAGAVKVRITDWFFWKSYADLKYIGLEDAVIKRYRKDSIWNHQFLSDFFSSKPDTAAKKDTSKGIAFNVKVIDLKNVRYTSDDEWDGSKMTVKVGSMVMDADTIDVERKLFLINYVDIDKPYFSIENFDGNGPVDTTSTPEKRDSGLYFNQGGIIAKIKSLKITNGFFGNSKRGRMEEKGVFDARNIQAGKLSVMVNNFSFVKDTIRADINVSAKERSGFELKNLTAAFKLTPEIMEFKNLDLQTNKSRIADYYAMRFKDFTNDMGDFVEKTVLDARFRNAQVNSDDIAYFAPELSSWKRSITINGKFLGTVSNFSVKELLLKTGGGTYVSGNLSMKGLPDINRTSIGITNASIQTNSNDISFLYPPIRTFTTPNLAALGNVRFTGTVGGKLTSYDIDGNLSTVLGALYAKITLGFPTGGEPVYKGVVETKQFNLGKFVNEPLLGNIGFSGNIDGYSFSVDSIRTSINGNFSNLEFNGYNYTNLTFDGSLQKQKFNGNFKSDDPNFDIYSTFNIDISGKVPVFKIYGGLGIAKLRELNWTPKDNFQITGLFDLNFSGRNIDEFLGSARLLNASLIHDTTNLDLDSLSINATLDSANGKVFSATSKQFDLNVQGKQYSILDLPKIFQMFLSRYYPSYIDPPRQNPKSQQFSFTIDTKDFSNYARLLDTSLSGFDNTHVEGAMNSADTSLP